MRAGLPVWRFWRTEGALGVVDADDLIPRPD